jgi:hypothetical protein
LLVSAHETAGPGATIPAGGIDCTCGHTIVEDGTCCCPDYCPTCAKEDCCAESWAAALNQLPQRGDHEPFICMPCQFGECTPDQNGEGGCHAQPGTGRVCECDHIDGTIMEARS